VDQWINEILLAGYSGSFSLFIQRKRTKSPARDALGKRVTELKVAKDRHGQGDEFRLLFGSGLPARLLIYNVHDIGLTTPPTFLSPRVSMNIILSRVQVMKRQRLSHLVAVSSVDAYYSRVWSFRC
jgi:hypothetical protein